MCAWKRASTPHSEASLRAFAARLRDTPIDWLIANAGILRSDALGSLGAQPSLREQLDVNAIGTLLTVEALLPQLHAPAPRSG